MSRRRDLAALAVAGLALAAAAVAAVLAVGAPNVLAGLVGAVLLLAATLLGLRRTAVDLDPDRGTPERATAASVPGDGFDRRLADERGRSLDRSSFTRERIRERLTGVAVRLLVAREGLTEAAARERLADAAWPDDGVAARFLAGERPDPTLRDRLAGDDGFGRGVARAVAALAAAVDRPAPPRPGVAASLRERLRWGGDGGDDAAPDPPEPGAVRRRSTGHWAGVGALALASLGVGVVGDAPGLALAGTLGVGYLAVAGLSAPSPAAVAVERAVAPASPAPGEAVTVRVTVRNEGDRPLPDVRVVDGVPDALAVVDGSPRHATALAPGAASTFAYDLRARRGVHEFDPAVVRTRSVGDGAEAETSADAGTRLTCRLRPDPADRPAVVGATGRFVGTAPADDGGPGVEFHSTRAYRRGDPVSRVDWNRLARTGELTTVDYRRERATTVVLVVDARASARVAPGPDAETALDRGVAAAARFAGGLLAAGNRVGLAAFGPAPLWADPAATRATDHRLRTLLTEHRAFAAQPPDGEAYAADWVDRFRAWVDGPATVLLCSPLIDDTAVALVDRLRRAGHPVTVCSPDPTAGDTVGRTLAGLERTVRLSTLRRGGTRVVDWGPETPLPTALTAARRRWSR